MPAHRDVVLSQLAGHHFTAVFGRTIAHIQPAVQARMRPAEKTAGQCLGFGGLDRLEFALRFDMSERQTLSPRDIGLVGEILVQRPRDIGGWVP